MGRVSKARWREGMTSKDSFFYHYYPNFYDFFCLSKSDGFLYWYISCTDFFSTCLRLSLSFARLR